MTERVDCLVIGAGVVGLAVAARLAALGRDVLVLERHELIGAETSSRNSEVIHAGIYYPAGSRKAALCVRGKALLYAHCAAYGVPHARCGKLIVATQDSQIATVRGYVAQAAANGVEDLRWLSQAEVHAMEPEVTAVGGVFSPSTGIVDSHAFMLSLQGQLEAGGGMIAFETAAEQLTPGSTGPVVEAAGMTLATNWLINCAGLAAPGVGAQLVDGPTAHFAKGHYYAYSGRQPFSRLVYPVAEEGGLGVHVTLDLAGQVKFGPDVCWIDNVDYDFDEGRFDAFVDAIRRYYPALDPQRLHASYTGIRPKLGPAGSGFQDFSIAGPQDHGVRGFVNLLGIESPGLTASLAIAETVGELVSEP